MKLSDREWKEFNLCGDICNFENFHGRRLVKNNRKIGLMPLLTAGENNNGVSDFISNNKMSKFKNVITIDMFGNSFFHDYYCLGDDNIYFFTNDKLSKFIKLFIVSLINKNKNKFSYGKQFRQKNANKLKILLPINEKNQPDWQFMEQYAKSIFDKKTTNV